VNFEKLRRHIKAAESATRILRKFSWWEIADFDTEKRIHAEKRSRLVSIVAEFNLSQAKLNNLITRTIAAVDDLVRSDGANARRALEQFGKLGDWAAEGAAEWGQWGHDIKDALQYHLDGTLGVTSPALSANQILENCDRSERLFAVLNNDLRWLAGELKTLRDVLDADSSRNPFEYNCVYRIASAWRENTGELPTFSFNKDAVSGHSKTKFQKYLEEATSSRPIGDMIMRLTLNAFRSAIGDAKAVKSQK
jgi:hypothetical protein